MWSRSRLSLRGRIARWKSKRWVVLQCAVAAAVAWFVAADLVGHDQPFFAPIAAVVIAGAALSGGLASATSTWMAALALTFLTQMLLIFGLSAAMQHIVFGAAIIVGMLVSGDRVASLLGRLLRRIETSTSTYPEVKENTS